MSTLASGCVYTAVMSKRATFLLIVPFYLHVSWGVLPKAVVDRLDYSGIAGEWQVSRC